MFRISCWMLTLMNSILNLAWKSVFLAKTLVQCLSPPSVWMGTGLWWPSMLSRGNTSTPSRFMLWKPELYRCRSDRLLGLYSDFVFTHPIVPERKWETTHSANKTPYLERITTHNLQIRSLMPDRSRSACLNKVVICGHPKNRDIFANAICKELGCQRGISMLSSSV